MKNTSLFPLKEGNSYVFSKKEVEEDSKLHSYDGKPLSKGSIYRAYVPFTDSLDEFKPRPVLVLSKVDKDDTNVKVIPFTSAITHKEEGDLKEKYTLNKVPHYKYPVLNWKNNYFDVPVYAVIDYNTVSRDYYVTLEKSYFLEPITARKFNNYSEYIMDESQFKEIREVLKCKRKGKRVSEVNPKTDPKSKYFDWKTMQIPYSEWMKYRKDILEKDKEDFKTLRLYYLYDKDSTSVGDMTRSEKIFKDNRPRKCRKTKDWATYEAYMGKYFSVIKSLQDEINSDYKDMLPIKKETTELKEHILSDEELRTFLEESL